MKKAFNTPQTPARLQNLSHFPENSKHLSNGLNVNFVDFKSTTNYAKTLPLYCFIKNEEIIIDKLSWANVLAAICQWLIKKNYPELQELSTKPLYGDTIFFLPHKAEFPNKSKLLSNGKWIKTTYNAGEIISIIRRLCNHCKINLGDVIIEYIAKDLDSAESKIDMSTLQIDDKYKSNIIEILLKHFPAGFRNDSIDISKFRKFSQAAKLNINLSDDKLKSLICNYGTLFDSKVYVVDEQIKQKIASEVEAIFSSGVKIIFYRAFYQHHQNWLNPCIVCDKMLKEILIKLSPQYVYRRNYFMTAPSSQNEKELIQISNEIRRVLQESSFLNCIQIAEILPYIPLDKIKKCISLLNDNLICNSKKEYALLSKVEIAENKQADILNYIEEACRKNKYACLTNIALDEIIQENYQLELDCPSVCDAIFKTLLSKQYARPEQYLITPKGSSLNSVSILKEYCGKVNKCTLQELRDYQYEQTFQKEDSTILEAAYAVMIRVDANNFIADKYCYFDISQIDEQLKYYIAENYLPIRAITTFASFSDCGLAWNLFVLESFCRRFSKYFRLEANSFNSNNLGIIARKDYAKTYFEIMADAAAAAKIPLDDNSVLNFLFENGYLGKHCYAEINKLITLAKNIREGKD
jgi:hypothetical protein